MAKDFKEVKPELIKDNPFKAIGSDWMLITAGTIKDYNMMTARWGGLGVLWEKKVCFCVIRPQRYTYGFMEKSQYFTLSFFGDKYKKILEFCGTKSGKDVNKTKETGLEPVEDSTGAVYFKQARLVIVARKIYFQDLDPKAFLDPSILDLYPNKDYHRMYVGEVIRCLVKSS